MPVMPNERGGRLRGALIAALAACLAGIAGAAKTPPSRLDDPPPSGPVVRIGLTADRVKVTLSADGPFRIIEPASGLAAWKKEYNEEMLVTTHGAPPSQERVWRVQVAAAATEAAAREQADLVAQQTGLPTAVSFNPDRGSWRVRAGAAPSRETLDPVLVAVRAAGYTDAWAVDEPAPGGQAWIRLVDAQYDTRALQITRILAEPGAREGGRESILSVNGRRYRGKLEILVDPSAGLRVVNVLPVEEYLRGVVPAELGPALWPELEAQEAQAIAARTYIVRNLGRFDQDGFDICDTPRCQVYEGVGSEHPLSDRAVHETAGRIATYEGQPINALYTSTCGGHTEDGGEVFPEEAAPYLVGVDCYPEDQVLRRQGAVIEGSAAMDTGAPAEVVSAIAGLVAAGILTPEALRPDWAVTALSDAEARELIHTAAGRIGLDGTIAEGRQAATRLGFPMALSDRMGGKDRAEFLVDARDLPVLLDLPEGAVPAADRRTAAALRLRGMLPVLGSGSLRPDALLSRGEAAGILARAASLYGVPEGGEGGFLAASRGASDGALRLRLKASGGPLELDLSAPGRLAVFVDNGAGAVPVPRVALYPGDRVQFFRGDEGDARVLTVLPRKKGLSDDRTSPTYAWEVTTSAADLDTKLAERFDVGSLRDIVTLRRGVSGRVTQVRLLGVRGETLVSGFNLRGALGLKDSPLVIEKVRDGSGGLRQVVFAGKGWGHGVGMCQVGAVGMAARGRRAEEILKHYYTGISIKKLW